MIRIFFTSLLYIICALAFVPSSAHSEPDAPFGLTWGAGVDDVRKIGVELKENQDTKQFGVSFEASKLSKVLSDQKWTVLSFGFSDKLWRIIAVSNDFSNNPYGTAVKDRYQELVGILAEKYGKPSSVHNLGSSIYSRPEYFLSGIQGGHSSWYSNFHTSELDVQLGIKATDRSTANWVLIFENKALRKTFESDRKEKEKGTLGGATEPANTAHATAPMDVAPITPAPMPMTPIPPQGQAFGASPCMEEFTKLHAETDKRAKAAKDAGQRKAQREEMCKLLRSFEGAIGKWAKYAKDNATSCGIPAKIIDQLKAGHTNIETTAKKVCEGGALGAR